MKKYSFNLLAMALFYVFAGLNHFVNPAFYLPLIPPYFPYHTLINVSSGVIEILLGILLIPALSRKWAAVGIIAMLIAFIPSHVYFIEVNSCAGDLCVPNWVGWFRLVVIHPVLIYWAWRNHNS